MRLIEGTNEGRVKMPILFDESVPSQEQFWRLFQTTGWNQSYRATPEELIQSVANSQWVLGAYDGNRLVAFGKIVTDQIIHAMVYDLIVLPDYQERGLGTRILETLVGKCLDHGIRDIQLFCAKGQSGFYRRRGFSKRPTDAPGMQYRRTA